MTTAFDQLMQGLTVVKPAKPSTPKTIPIVDLALPLMDFQVDAIIHAMRDLNAHPYAYVALDMGLGKTPVGITIAASLVAAGHRNVLIVVPPSLRINWLRELRKFAPWLSVSTIKGAKPEQDEDLGEQDVLIIGDSSLSGYADFLTGKVGGLIVDEAHRFKNTSQRTAALVQIGTGVKKTVDAFKRITYTRLSWSIPAMRVLMSGTPTPNGRHTELASQVDVLGDEAWRDLGGKSTFWHHYAPKVDQFGTRTNNDGAGLYQALTGSFFYRRLRGDVLTLPNKGRTPISLEGEGKGIKEYKEAEKDLIAYLAGRQDGKVTEGQRRSQALIKLNVLRRLSGVVKVKAAIEHIKDILDNEQGGVFVVAEHSAVIDDLMVGLLKYKPTSIRGGMTDAQKQAEVDDFNSGKSRVMVGQIIAAGVGLTLHGNGINHRVVVVQMPWTPADLMQAEDRLHRIGQTHDVMVEVALATIEGTLTIDERLWGALEAKYFNMKVINDGQGEYLLSEIQDSILDSYRS